MSPFEDLQPSHRASLLGLRDRTTYLWPEIVQICRAEGTTLTCSIRAKTLLEVEGALIALQDAGFFSFNKITDDHSDHPKLYRLQIQGITDRFKHVVNSMEPSNNRRTSSRPKGLIRRIKSRLLGP
ncbi:MAG: hypothetical protein HQL07_10530 [Nitrospirae bacterium]|nr:hypothetical protein [Magnetococcales bacterium]HAT48717.1 hypothetical protein [Alphaproteobacteria bacterium]